MLKRWNDAALVATLLMCMSACQQQPAAQEAPSEKPKAKATGIDAEMQAKMAQAKAEFEKLTPAEKKKLAAEFARTSSTLPLPLGEAGALKVQRSGQAPTTLADLAPPGTPTIIAAWASWCVPCKVEARELARLRKEYTPKQLNIAYLNIGDPKVEADKGPEFLRQAGAEDLGLTMIDNQAFLKLTRVKQLSVPRVLVYARSGKPTQVISGGTSSGADPRLIAAIKKVAG